MFRGENAFTQIIDYNFAGDAAKPAKGFRMQLCPCLRTSAEHQQAN